MRIARPSSNYNYQLLKSNTKFKSFEVLVWTAVLSSPHLCRSLARSPALSLSQLLMNKEIFPAVSRFKSRFTASHSRFAKYDTCSDITSTWIRSGSFGLTEWFDDFILTFVNWFAIHPFHHHFCQISRQWPQSNLFARNKYVTISL